jgi:NADPH:quinone reductase-like Zn-dependent oxidoreductase
MRIIRQQKLGEPEVLELTEQDAPEPIPTEIQVRVHAAGLNPVDLKCRRGGGFLGEPPFTVGWDVSGVVSNTGFGTTRFAEGDEVLGMPWFPRPASAYADYVTAPARHFVAKPPEMSHEEAAGLPLAGLTAWQALVDLAGLRSGQRVLIHAAAGGVGHLAVQIAKALGAYVIGTASAGKHEFLHEIGIDEAIDYHSTKVADAVSDVDVVLDLIGGQTGIDSLPALRTGGLLIAVPSGVSDDVAVAAKEHGVRSSPFLVEPDHAGLASLVNLALAGKLEVYVERAFDLTEAVQAHQLAEEGHTTGKIVLTTGA